MVENIELIQNLPHFNSIFIHLKPKCPPLHYKKCFLDTKQWTFSFKKLCSFGA